MYYPSLKEFIKKSKKGNLIPVYREILADFETPVSAFTKIDTGDYSYLLESAEKGERLGRYSFLGSNPSLIFKSKGKRVEIISEGKKETQKVSDPLSDLKKLMADYKFVKVKGLPRFVGGMVGYLSYDMVRFFEKLPDKNPDDLNLPDAIFLLTDTLLIFDHLEHKIKVISNAYIKKDPRKAYQEAVRKIEDLIEKLKKPIPQHRSPITDHRLPITIKSNFTKEAFKKSVRKAKEYIRAGDIIQAVLSQRLETKITVNPFDIYRALRTINPSPYMYYLKCENLKLIGSSPEILVRLEEGMVEVRPIAGTRPRGRTEKEDRALEKELLADPKERAEHIMLVDLGRNDVGRVAEFGTVKVNELMVIERYSHVMHIVSDVTGKLKKGRDGFDVLRASFPAGTVTGAPKIRAMEIIDELEPVRRGLYAGAVGYFSFSGNLDTCITIRTIIIKGKQAYIQAGAGIVADSVPEREYQETINKAKALIKAIEKAERGLE
ncbi:anthranilate synthase component I [bacterium]|nr:anthranilate synthase component I [bacterium]